MLASLGAVHKRLTLTQFRVYIDQLTEDMTQSEFEQFADYLLASVEVRRIHNIHVAFLLCKCYVS